MSGQIIFCFLSYVFIEIVNKFLFNIRIEQILKTFKNKGRLNIYWNLGSEV